MPNQIVTVIIQEGSKLLSEYLRFRPAKQPQSLDPITTAGNALAEISAREELIINSGGPPDETPKLVVSPAPTPAPASPAQEEHEDYEEKAASIVSGCVPCALGHYGTCSGLLSEAVRFGHGEDGVASDEVLDRVGMCLDELNAMERVDLRPQMITALPGWEKEIAQQALDTSRKTRHMLEDIKSPDHLEEVSASITTARQELYRDWAKKRLKNMSPDEQAQITQRVLAKIGSEEDDGE